MSGIKYYDTVKKQAALVFPNIGKKAEDVPDEIKLKCINLDINSVKHYTKQFVDFIGGSHPGEHIFILAGMRNALKALEKGLLVEDFEKKRYKELCDFADKSILTITTFANNCNGGSNGSE
jgi:hypothetical protein